MKFRPQLRRGSDMGSQSALITEFLRSEGLLLEALRHFEEMVDEKRSIRG
jgi:hypothetical protein